MSLPVVNATGNITVSSNVEVHCNSSGGSFTVTLPAGTSNDVVKFIDVGRNWNSNPVTVITSGGNTFYDGSTSYSLSYPGLYEVDYLGDGQWIYFSTLMQDPNIVNNLSLSGGLSGSILNNTMSLSFSSVENPNTVYAGPASGSSGATTFRQLVSKDLNTSTVSNGLFYDNSGSIAQSSDLTFSGTSLSTPALNLASSGSVNLSSGFATVTTNKVTSTCLIFLTVQSSNSGTVGNLRVTSKVAGTSFNIQSSSPTDVSTVGWMIINN